MKAIAAANMDREILSELEKLGFEIMPTVPNTAVLPPLAHHPDMQIARFENYAVCEPAVFDAYRDFILSAGVSAVCGKTALKSTYPDDVAYNISEVGDLIFHRTDCTDGEIVRLASKKFVCVRQGYSGCSVCKTGGGAMITSDVSVKRAADSAGTDCLLISTGGIHLTGFDCGFIGGASFFYGGTVYFFGDAGTHPDFDKIKIFCERHETEIRMLKSGILSDYGSLITLD